MTYKLAKQLKDAGFSQKKGKGICWEPTHFGASGNIVKKPHTEHCVYIPILEELIDACGERFVAVERAESLGERKGWIAFSNDIHLNKLRARGKTPSEAVAKLYIKLNNK